MGSRATPGQAQYLLLVIALFSSQFELENASRGVKLSMDLSVARARPGDGTQWDWPQPRSQRAFGPRSPLQERRTHRKAAPVYGPSLCRAASPACSAARRMRPTCWLGAATAWSTDSNAITLSGWRAPLTRKVIVP